MDVGRRFWGIRHNPFGRNGRWTSKTEVKLRFWGIRRNPFARNGRWTPKTDGKTPWSLPFQRASSSGVAVLDEKTMMEPRLRHRTAPWTTWSWPLSCQFPYRWLQGSADFTAPSRPSRHCPISNIITNGFPATLFLWRAPPADGWGRRICIYMYLFTHTHACLWHVHTFPCVQIWMDGRMPELHLRKPTSFLANSGRRSVNLLEFCCWAWPWPCVQNRGWQRWHDIKDGRCGSPTSNFWRFWRVWAHCVAHCVGAAGCA